MRASVASLSKKLISTLFAAALAFGLVPSAAFAAPNNLQPVPGGMEGDVPVASSAEGGDTDAFSHYPSEEPSSADGDAAAASPEEGFDNNADPNSVISTEASDSERSGEISIPAAVERVNQDMALTTPVAQTESVRTYFLAQTLESTRTVPMVSANLPLDTSIGDETTEPDAEGEGGTPSEDEGGEDSDDPDSEDDPDRVISTEGSDSDRNGEISPASTVIGSFTYEGMTFAIEAGGESVALVAVDYNQLPEQFIQMQVVIIPETATPDGIDYYSVTRIADNAFSSLTKENTNPDYKGCEALFTNEELLAEAGIDAAEVEAFLNPESDMIDIDGDGLLDAPANPLKDCTGILSLGIPSSVSSIEDDALAGFDTLQYIVISEDNTEYASFDGALYGADLTSLQLIPEGRVGAVWVAPSWTDIDPEVLAHCPLVAALAVDSESKQKSTLWLDENRVTPLRDILLLQTQLGEAPIEKLLEIFMTTQSMTSPSDSPLNTRISSAYTNGSNGYFSQTDIPTAGIYCNYGGYKSDGTMLVNCSKSSWDHTNAYYVSMVASNAQNQVVDSVYLGDSSWDGLAGYSSGAKTKLPVGASSTSSLYMSTTGKYGSWTKILSSPKTRYKLPTTGNLLFLSVDGNVMTYLGNATITWNANGGSSNSSGDQTVGANLTLPSNPTRTGYTFAGWYTAASGGTQVTSSTKVPSAATTYYAHWTAKTSALTFNLNSATSGTAPTGKTATYGAAMPAYGNTAPVRTGYTFGGFYDATSGGTQYYTAALASARNWNKDTTAGTTLYARWTAKTSALTFNLNSATSGTAPTGKTATYGAAMPAYGNTAPTRTGYTFGGFYDATSGGTQYYTAALASARNWNKDTTAGTTLYARWTANTYTVSFNANGGSGGQTANVTATYAANMPAISTTKPTRTGYTFGGFYDTSAATGGTQYYTAACASARTWNKTAATTLYARWTANTYTVSFNANGGSGGQTANVTATYGSAMPAISTTKPTRTGYTFAGWYDTNAATGGNMYYTAACASNQAWNKTAATTLYARWTANTYTVSFNGNGGSGGQTANVTATYGSAMPAISTTKPTRTGYTFAGWYDTNAATGGNMYYTAACASNQAWNKTAATTLYARWTANTYTVSFNANGGSGGQTANVTATYNAAMPAISTTKPTKTGYTFAGFYDATSGGTQYYTAACASARAYNKAANATLYAQYTANTYTVSFNANGGSGGQTANVTATYGSAMPAISTTKPTRTGYTFAGWYDTNAATGGNMYYTAACASNQAWNKTANTTLYARWTGNPIAITWNTNGGSANTSGNQTCGNKLTLPANPTRTGYSFAGWYTAASGGTKVDGNTIVPTVATTYYAQWTGNPIAITWNANGGASNSSGNQTAGAKLTLPAQPTRAGYTFAGWYTDATAGTKIDGNTLVPVAATTYYAHWTGNSISIIWNGNGGTDGSTVAQTYKDGEKLVLPSPDPTREGYTFKGWFTERTGGTQVTNGTDLPTSNPTYYAQWDVNSYTLNWVSDGWSGPRTESVPYATVIDWPDPGKKEAHVFIGWQASGKDTALYAVDANGKLPTFAMKAGEVTLTAQWEAAYAIDFVAENPAFVKSIDVTGTTVTNNAIFLRDTQLTPGATVRSVTVNTDYYHKDYGFDRFVVKGADLTSLGWMREGSDSWTRDPFTFDKSTIETYFPDGPGTLLVHLEFHDEDYVPVGGTSEVDPLTHWKAKLDLAGGALSADDAKVWTGSVPTVDFTHRSPAIALPTPTKVGHNFKGWSGVYDDAVHGSETPNCVTIAPGSIWSRTYTANWTPKTATIEFSYNAAGPAQGQVGVPDPVKPVTYGAAMPSVGDKAPTREGYRFVGFFDTKAATGGRNYYTSELKSARAWDKDLEEGATYTLYARWTREADTLHTHRVVADPARGVMSSTPHAGAAGAGQTITVFNADYTGVYAWESYDVDAKKPAASEMVTIDVSSYAFANGFDIKKIPALFDYDNPNPDGPRYRLLGFNVGSGADMTFIPFTDLLDGNHFRLKLHGYEMVLTGDGTTPADFKLPALSVEPVYTTGYPGYVLDPDPDGDVVWPKPADDDDTPKLGDRIVTVFDAGPGTFPSGRAIETTETVYDGPVVTPGKPSRPGYDFAGWSLEDEHEGDDCDCEDTDLPDITSKTPRTFKAHWAVKSYEVYYVETADTKHLRSATYDEMLPALGTQGGAPKPTVREGYRFMGYYDTERAAGSFCYIDSDGAPVRAWDIDDSPVYLYAHWALDTTTPGQEPVEPVKPTPDKPDPENPPFPGVDQPWKSVPTNPDDDSESYLRMPVVAGDGTSVNVYDGVFDGVMRFTDRTNADKPAAANDNVQLTVYSYEPDGGKSARDSFEAMRRAFEAAAPEATPYLQGFKVVSTGWAISLNDLIEGRTVMVQCMGADLDWSAVHANKTVMPASAVFKPGKVVAVYSATPVIDPGTGWPSTGNENAEPPVPATQVFNSFDAYCGRFPVGAADGAALTNERMRTVASDYKGKLQLPLAPRYDVEGHEFEGWYLADGTKVDENTTVTWSTGVTIYAHYKQIFFTLEFSYEDQVFEPMREVWKGQDPANLRAEFQKRTPVRAGYDFVGWAVFPNGLDDEDSAIPYYLAGSASDWTGEPLAKAVDTDAVLYPLWTGRTYTITWRYDHGRFQFHPTQMDTWTKVKYGDSFDSLPVPENPRYPFLGWYPTQPAAGDASVARGYDAIAGEGLWFTEVGGKYVFAPPAEKDASSAVVFYAGWDMRAPIPYTITLNAGEGPNPTFGVAGTSVRTKTVDASYDPNDPTASIDVYDEAYIPYMNLAGWKFAGWKDVEGEPFAQGEKIALGSGDHEFTAQWEIAEEGAYAISFLKGSEVSGTGPDAVDWWLEGDEEYRMLDIIQTRFDAGTEVVAVPKFAPTSTVGYEFAGWQRVKKEATSDAETWVDVKASSEVPFTTIATDTTGFTGQDLVQRAATEDVTEFAFRAVWAPKTFEVRYFMEDGNVDGEATYQQMDMGDVDTKDYLDVAYDQKITLPEPAFYGIGAIFERWDGRNRAATASKVTLSPGKTFTLRDIVAEVGRQSVTEEDGHSVLSLYGVTTPGMSFTVPLQVTIALDLERPEESVIAGTAAIETTQTKSVEVKSVELLRYGTDDALELADGTDGSQHVNLLVQAHKAEDGTDLDAAKYLTVNLGARNEGARYRADALADHGFGTFTSASPLRLNYRLALDLPEDGGLTGSSYAKLLGIRDMHEADGTRTSLPIAKLFYTVGLADTTQS